ncbi:hypothetical protein SAMN05216522_102230 [Rosenbergiella nectarea]|uniref:Uncharacterized protein n=2 Tax=Rosenbergiella nectarea TaxID=988801 RepID=A0A1H9FBI4_9GAMM|nr:hypothetical protein SAMN05216522_102230 [Rosenbergiella nectarea]
MFWVYSLYILLVASPAILILINSEVYRSLDKLYFERFSIPQQLHWLDTYRGSTSVIMKWGIYGMILTQKKYNPKHRLFRNVSEEEYNFIKEAPAELQKKILREMLIRRCLLYAIGLATIAIFLFGGGLDYLLEPVTHENIMQGISLL